MSALVPGVSVTRVPPPVDAALETGVPVFLGWGHPAAGGAPITLHSAGEVQSVLQGAANACDPDPYLVAAVVGFFQCGGRQCQVFLIPTTVPLVTAPGGADSWIAQLDALLDLEGFDLVAAPSLMWDPACTEFRTFDAATFSLDQGDIFQVQREILAICERRGDCFAILDCLPSGDTTLLQGQVDAIAPAAETPSDTTARSGALYFPWVRIAGSTRCFPPSGHIAGTYHRIDHATGIVRAPANLPLTGAVDVAVPISDSVQSGIDLRVNCLRSFPGAGRGIVAWGARTLSTDAAWASISVRRLFTAATRWLCYSLRWAAMEPNDMSLRLRVTRQLDTHFDSLHRLGLLRGVTATDAYSVRCDAANNPPEVRRAGQLVVEIGLAPAVPGEMINLLLTQSSDGATVVTAA